MTRSFVSVCTGDKYPDKYVDILYNMVSRHTKNFKFFVITDRQRQLNPNIQQVIIKQVFPYWWNKVHLFNPEHPFMGTILYMDLDVVIFRNIEKLWDFNQNGFTIIQDFNRCRIPGYHVKNSSVMKWKHGHYNHLWNKFLENPNAIIRKYKGDQDYLTKELKDPQLWPRDWVMSYKWEIGLEPEEKRRSPNDKFLTNRITVEKTTRIKDGKKTIIEKYHKHKLPEECSVAVFHGKPNPAEITKDPLVIDNWR